MFLLIIFQNIRVISVEYSVILDKLLKETGKKEMDAMEITDYLLFVENEELQELIDNYLRNYKP